MHDATQCARHHCAGAHCLFSPALPFMIRLTCRECGAGEGQMDDRIGRLAASFGVDRTATERAVGIVERRPIGCAPSRARTEPGHTADRSARSAEHSDCFKLGSICVSFIKGTTVGSRRSTATARHLCAVAAVTRRGGGHARERTGRAQPAKSPARSPAAPNDLTFGSDPAGRKENLMSYPITVDRYRCGRGQEAQSTPDQDNRAVA